MRIRGSEVATRRAAEAIARAIELDIIAADLPPGAMIGSEAELIERYGVSRGVIREAVTLVESHMLAETRRGIGGGLVVAEPDASVVEDIVSLFLARKKATEHELHEVRIALEVLALRKVMANLDDHARTVLRDELAYEPSATEDMTAASQRFHLALAELSGNKVLQLFVPTTTALVEEMWTNPEPMTRKQRRDLWTTVSSCHAEIIQAMLTGRTEFAVALLQVHLEQVADAIEVNRQVQVSPLD